jgi:methylglutaconyl-CoA hydratase
MDDLHYEVQNHIGILTLNRVKKHNAFDDVLISELHHRLTDALHDTSVQVILLKAEGKHFCAGADLSWMQRMISFSFDDNIKDAMGLAAVMFTLHHSPKPTIAMVQGSAFGGGAGLAAACDVVIAADTARFCFSETALGLIPAIISPYVVKAIGERVAAALFMSAEVFDAERALALHLVHHCVPEAQLLEHTLQFANQICQNAPLAVREAKQLARFVALKPIDHELVHYTAELIAKKRVSKEGQEGIQAFLNKLTRL